MKALIIGNRKRYEKYMPHLDFVNQVEKIFVDLSAPLEEYPKEAFDADFLAADAIAKVPRELLAKMPNLTIIHSEGVGFNGIDVDAAAQLGIPVCNNKGINASAVAEQTVLLMLGLLRTVVPGDTAVREGRQIEMKERRMVEGITELSECQIGLVGFGDIARALARLLKPFGCPVFYCAKTRKSPALEQDYQVSYLPLEKLTAESDMVSLHIPANAETAGMVNESFLRNMKPTTCLINTSRGEIVDNLALRKALIEGWIAGAGLDTIAPEPVSSKHPLVDLPEEVREKVLYSPHLGGITSGTFRRAHTNIWTAFEKVSRGETPANIVNGQKLRQK